MFAKTMKAISLVLLRIVPIALSPLLFFPNSAGAADQTRPNIILILADDMGYSDLGVYGAKKHRTPHLDAMAAEGVRFTDFHVAQAVCSASRAALLTGCYPNRIGILGALGPASKRGINKNETTVAELLKARGYATAIYGKWHLGFQPQFLPQRHGFDDYFGLPYSNDMWPFHPEAKPGTYPELPLIEGEKIIQHNPDQTKLTTWYTERAVQFIERNHQRPFFLYVPHAMPHVPLFVSEKFRGKSEGGLYGDVIEEIDWSVGQILAAIKKHQLDDNTLIIFTSDNGPWLLYGDHAGTAQPLREGKATTFEGGLRVPCLMRWPGKIPAGSICRELALTMDALPTIAGLTGAELPKEHKIDGKDIWPLVTGQPGAKTPHEAFFYYWSEELQAVRSGKWKLHFQHSYPKPDRAGGAGKPGKYATQQIGIELFDLETDVSEKNNVASKHPDVVKRLQLLADQARDDLGDSASKRQGKNLRPSGIVAQ
jgi:arylsulfatase A